MNLSPDIQFWLISAAGPILVIIAAVVRVRRRLRQEGDRRVRQLDSIYNAQVRRGRQE